MQASLTYAAATVQFEMTEFKTNQAELETIDSKPGKTKRENTDQRIQDSVRPELGLQMISVNERFNNQGVNGYSSQIEQIELLEAVNRTLLEDVELLKAKLDLKKSSKKVLKETLTKINQKVCGFADYNGLGKYTDNDLYVIIKSRIPLNTYENLYVTSEPHVFCEGEKLSRKIQLIRSETFLEDVAAFFDAIPAFFSSLFTGKSDFRIAVEGNLIADELLDAKKITGEGLPIEPGDRSVHIQRAFRQWLSIEIWIPNDCKSDAIVQLTQSSQIIQWSIKPGRLINHLIGRQ